MGQDKPGFTRKAFTDTQNLADDILGWKPPFGSSSANPKDDWHATANRKMHEEPYKTIHDPAEDFS